EPDKSRSLSRRSGNAQSSVNDLHKVPLFTEDETLTLRKSQVFASLRIGLQSRSIGLIGRETIECNQTPPHIIRALIRKKISDKVSPTTGNNASPVLGIFLERIALERVDL